MRLFKLFPSSRSSLHNNDTMSKAAKKSGETINQKLALVMKSGKYVLGYKTTLKAIRTGKAKLIILASNTPPLRKSYVEYYSHITGVDVEHYKGDNIALGTACGRYFRVGCIAIIDPGDSDIVESIQEKTRQ